VAQITNSDELSGGTAEADEVLIPKTNRWADQKQLTGMQVSQF